jgi:hypothetical protein
VLFRLKIVGKKGKLPIKGKVGKNPKRGRSVLAEKPVH